MNTILVVGGAGFIGSHVAKMLHQRGYNVVVYDNLSTGTKEAVIHSPLIHGCLSDLNALDHLFSKNKIDSVLHFAAYIDVGESVRNPAKYYLNNVAYTLNLLEVMRKHGVDKLIFSSTAAIYGIPIQDKINEEHPKAPINPYGETKLTVEKILNDYSAAYGLRSISLRYFNAAGGDPEGIIKNTQGRSSNLIPLVVRHLKGIGSPEITVYGTDYPTPDGTCIRDYIHIEDLGSAHIEALEKLINGATATAYNLGNGNGFSVKEVIDAAERVTGLKVRVKHGERRPGDPAKLIADASKAQKELGWIPQYPTLETIISHAWNASK